MKRFWTVTLVGALGFALAGCGTSGQGSTSEQAGDTAGVETATEQEEGLADDAIKIEEIDYDVSLGVDGSSRRAMFSYTNNSDYTIVGVELEMVFPEDIESEDIAEPFDYILEQGVSEEDLLESTMTCDNLFTVAPGESSSDTTFSVYGYYVTGVEQFELMEPDLMTIRFLHDGLVYEEYYDYRSESYSLSSDTMDPNQWGTSELAQAIPQPEDVVVTDYSEFSGQYSFSVSSMTQEAFRAYINACEDAGYTVDVTQTDSNYYADNEDGTYHIDLIYWPESGNLDGYVKYIEEE